MVKLMHLDLTSICYTFHKFTVERPKVASSTKPTMLFANEKIGNCDNKKAHDNAQALPNHLIWQIRKTDEAKQELRTWTKEGTYMHRKLGSKGC